METKFQTSFIPKKPLVSDQRSYSPSGGTSIVMLIAMLIFIASLGGAVFVVVWANVLNKNQQNYKVQLADSEGRFNTTLIETLKRANTKIDLSKKLLNNHLDVAAIFSIVGALTIEGVRFNSFDFSAPAKDSDEVKISMHGVGNSFSAIAFQSSVFSQSDKYGTNKILKNPILSDLAVDQNGSVGFTFSSTVNPADLSYEKSLEKSNE